MTQRPKSHRALVLSVLSAQHPDIDAVDRAILAAIAQNASDLGAGSRPGNAMLCAVAGIGERALRYRTAKLVRRLKLVTRTEYDGGRGLASVYTICWQHPAFPDKSPNGREWYIEKPGNLDCPVSDDKPGKANPETRQSDAENPARQSPKPGNLDFPTSPDHPHINPIQPLGASAPNPGADWEGFLGSLTDKGMPCLSKSEQRRLRALLEGIRVEGGEGKNSIYKAWQKQNAEPIRQATVSRAVGRFLGREKGLFGLKNPWAVFFSEAPQLLPTAQEDAMHSLFGESPEGQRALDALARMNVDNTRGIAAPDKSVEELLKELKDDKAFEEFFGQA